VSVLREAPPSAHRCSLPRNEFRDAETDERVDYPIPPAALTGVTDPQPQREVVYWPGVGVVWQCDDCGQVWVSYWDPGYDGRHFSVCGSVKWRREKRRERKARERSAVSLGDGPTEGAQP
jgi:hypothetical protein